MSFSISPLRFGSFVSVLVSLAAFGAAACSGKSETHQGTGGRGSGATGATGGTAGGAGGSSGNGGGTGGKAGRGSGGATGGSSGSGGTAGSGGSIAGQGGSGAATGGTTGGGVAGEGGEGGGMNDDRPVLERPVREELSCQLTTQLENQQFAWALGDLAATSGGTFLAWGQPSEVSAPDSVQLATVDQTGTLGTTAPVASYLGSYASRPRLTASSRGMTLAWAEAGANEMSRFRVAELDSAGNVTRMPVAVPGITERLSDPAVAPTPDGNALLFVNTSVDYTTSRVRLALLDEDAAVVGDIVDLETTGDGATPQVGELIPIPGGFAATYSRFGLEAESVLVFLGADGKRQGEPIPLGSARPYLGQSLLVRGDELIVAYGDEDGGYENSDIAGFIALARFDLASHAPKGSVVRVQTPTVGEEATGPVLFSLGEDLGVMWSRGSVIYICAGCMPDNHLEAVIMDGDDFTPISTLLTFPNNEPMGGFVRPMVAPAGEHFVVAADLRFHVSGNPATGAFRCSPVP